MVNGNTCNETRENSKVHMFLSHVVSEEQGGNVIHKPADI